MRNSPVLRIRRSGAVLVAALLAIVSTIPLAGQSWALAPILLIPLLALIWAARSGTDVYPDRLTVRALVGSTNLPWERVAQFAPDRRGRISALLDNGNQLRLTAVTTENLPRVLAAGGQRLGAEDDGGSVTVDDGVDEGRPGQEPA